MQTATVLVKTSDTHTIPVKGVTPPEAQVLIKIHFKGANGLVIQEAVQTADVSGANEFNRLASKYGGKVVEDMYPGINKRLPQTFAEIGVNLAEKSSVVAAPAPQDLATDVTVSEEAPEVEPAPAPVPSKPEPKVSKKKLP